MNTSLPWSSKAIKYLLFAFNLIFFIIGITILSVGVSVKAYYYNYETFLDDQYFSAPNLLIAIGVIIFFIAFFGCCGAIKENYCMTITFSTLLILVFVLQLAAGIAGYALRNQTYEFLQLEMNHTMSLYHTPKNYEATKMWDVVQSGFECCGIAGPADWTHMNNTGFLLPISCCKRSIGALGNDTCTMDPADEERLFKTGCLAAFGDFIKGHALTIGGVGIGFAFVQLLGIIFSCHLSRQIKYHYDNM